MTHAYHFVGKTLRDGSPIPPDGEWLGHYGPMRLCAAGLHASLTPWQALYYAPGATLCLVDVDDIGAEEDDKLVARWRWIHARFDATDLLYEHARQSALSVLRHWKKPVPSAVLEYLHTGNPSLRSAARSAAESAARSAARSAAESAARSTARSTAESAAWSAAESAARSTAWSTAESAAWSAAESAAESAAWSVAWIGASSTARSAAESAAESAAWSAAESAARSVAWIAAESAARSVAWIAAESAARSAAKRAAADRFNRAVEAKFIAMGAMSPCQPHYRG